MSPLRRFLAYGVAGLVIENLFTGAASILAGDLAAPTRSYLWMVLIYGAGACFMREFLAYAREFSISLRIGYALMLLYLMEMSAGGLLLAIIGRIPWDYGEGPWTPAGIVNFAYAPFWAVLLIAFDWHVRGETRTEIAR
jgi:hypothetical protein